MTKSQKKSKKMLRGLFLKGEARRGWGPIQVDTVHEAITWLSVLVSQDKITHWHLVIRALF